MVIIFSVLVSGKKGRISRNPGCFFRIGSTSLRTKFTTSSFFSCFGMNSTMRANMIDSPFPFEDWCDPQAEPLCERSVYESTSLNDVKIPHKKSEVSDSTYTTL